MAYEEKKFSPRRSSKRTAQAVMKLLFKFLRLPSGRRRILLEAVLAYGFTRGWLHLFPHSRSLRAHTFRAINDGVERARPSAKDLEICRTVNWAFTTLQNRSSYFENCLSQALAARLILRRRRVPTRIHIGVRTEQKFSAHAWLACGEFTIVGKGHDLESYAPLQERRLAPPQI